MLRLTMTEGLPSNTIYSLLQDKKGYLWVTTDNGMAKYNGYAFRLFNSSNELPLEMFGMYEDVHQRLWVDYYGYSLAYIKNNKVNFINYKFSQNAIRSFRTISRGDKIFYFDNERKHYLVEIDSNDKTTAYPVPIEGAMFIHPEPDKFLNLGSDGLSECRLADGKVQCRFLCALPPPMQSAQIIQKNITDSGYFSYAPGANFFHFYNIYTCSYKQVPISSIGGTDNENVFLLYRLGKFVYVLTDNATYILNLNLKLVERKDYRGFPKGLSQISFFVRDSLNNEWYATTADGLLMQPSVPAVFKANQRLSALAKSVNVGNSASGNSYWWNSKQKQLYAVTPDLSIKYSVPIPSSDVQAVHEQEDELIIALTQSVFNGVYSYNIRQRKRDFFTAGRHITLTHHTDTTNKVFFSGYENTILNGIFNLHEYQPNVFFATQRGAGIYRIARTDDSVRIDYFGRDRYPGMVYDSINGKYWLYNKDRLALFDPETGKFAVLSIGQLRKLNINSIAQIQFDHRHNVFILTDKQIVQFNTRTFAFRYIPANVDLSNVRMLTREDMLFIAGNFGIGYAILSGTDHTSAFTIFQNIRRNYFNRIYGLAINPGGNIILSTDKAVYTFSLAQLQRAKSEISNKDDFMRLVMSHPVQQAVHSHDTILLPQETDLMSFDVINFYGSGPRLYSYRIEGKDEWQTTEAGEVFVSDVAPGTFHTFQVYVKDDIWKSKTYTFTIYRIPYWYQTRTWRIFFWIAGTLSFIILVSVIVLLTKNIVARSNEKRQLLTDLELRALHAQINPHFIFNTLGSALYFISKRKMDDAYLHVNKFSRLLRAYLRSSRNRYITLSEELEMLKNYIELQQIRFENKFDYEIDVENKIAADSVQIPSLLLQPLVENAINHGLFHLPEEKKGLLLIKFRQGSSSDELICTIEDNGVGRQKAREIKRSSDAQYESYGTKLTQELINIFKKYEKMNIYLEYIDKPEPESGTIVKLTIRNLKYVA